ncbi:hypothetical protein EWM64_g5848 [Hericium alpestre]|uniref:Uncharacterized protein n=1 Tax=Hericium alpestre TaxID=135208 RepID=A0A4Y9ZXD5_9AGAM|nr:hypothetical protein EWM64_g5848 [Hericium alpestre]
MLSDNCIEICDSPPPATPETLAEWIGKGKTWTDIRLPFCALSFWAALLEAITAKATWTKSLSWLNKKITSDPSLAACQVRVNAILSKTPWKGIVEGLGWHISVTEMATLLSEQQLSDEHIDTMLCLLAVRFQCEEPHLSTFISLGTMSLADGLCKSPALILKPGPDILPYPNAVPADVMLYGDRLAADEVSVVSQITSFLSAFFSAIKASHQSCAPAAPSHVHFPT